ncbi:hypothetical protein BDQ17DRAFT_1438098 [Cyathus striatus]|nr:hypothetical protein BDQ17DRAFT_1438098 [Cyathus striatus]
MGTLLIRILTPCHVWTVQFSVMGSFVLLAIGQIVLKNVFGSTMTTGTIVWPSWTGITQLSIDALAEIWLVVMPAYILWNVHLPRGQQLLIRLLFGSSILAAIPGVACRVFLTRQNPTWVEVMAHLQVSVAMIVCNTVVIGTHLYILFFRTGDSRVESSEENSNTDGLYFQSDLLAMEEIPLDKKVSQSQVVAYQIMSH